MAAKKAQMAQKKKGLGLGSFGFLFGDFCAFLRPINL
jgi:hypothetical protein